MEYILGLGSNLGDRRANLEQCVHALNLTPYTDVLKVSPIYETAPVGYVRQDDFYNCVLQVKSTLDAHEMLGLALGIESGMGRERGIPGGPRIIDVDLLMAEGNKCDTANLKLPHPRMFERRFVLQPLYDLFPTGVAYGTDFNKRLAAVQDQQVTKTAALLQIV